MSTLQSCLDLLSRRSRAPARSTLADSGSPRVEVRPPSLCHAPDSSWQRVMMWLLAPAPADAALPLSRLPAVRADFQACLQDVCPRLAETLSRRIDAARSLRDLWHLRTEVYRVVALAHSQHLAEQRVAGLNRHFSTRAARSNASPLP
jgi:hypothetical protein